MKHLRQIQTSNLRHYLAHKNPNYKRTKQNKIIVNKFLLKKKLMMTTRIKKKTRQNKIFPQINLSFNQSDNKFVIVIYQ